MITDMYQNRKIAQRREAIVEDFWRAMKGDPKLDAQGQPMSHLDSLYSEHAPYAAEEWHPIYQLAKRFGFV